MTLLFNTKNLEIRKKSNDLFFYFLINHGQVFSKALWKSILQGILTPFIEQIFSNMSLIDISDSNKIFMDEFFKKLSELISIFFDILQFLFIFIIDFTVDCINEKKQVFFNLLLNEITFLIKFFIKNSLHLILFIIEKQGKQFSEEMWKKILNSLNLLYENSFGSKMKKVK